MHWKSPEESNQDDLGLEAPLLLGEPEKPGTVHPGEEEAQGEPQCLEVSEEKAQRGWSHAVFSSSQSQEKRQ